MPFEIIFVVSPRKKRPYRPSFSTTILNAWMYVMGSSLVCVVVLSTLRELLHVSDTAVAQKPTRAFVSNRKASDSYSGSCAMSVL